VSYWSGGGWVPARDPKSGPRVQAVQRPPQLEELARRQLRRAARKQRCGQPRAPQQQRHVDTKRCHALRRRCLVKMFRNSLERAEHSCHDPYLTSSLDICELERHMRSIETNA
jgi:hypothetical protein